MNVASDSSVVEEVDCVVVGIGTIGRHMAACLAAADDRLVAVDPSAAARDWARAHGISAVPSLSDVTRVEFVVVMVATPTQLQDLVSESLAGGTIGRRWIVMSTVGPDCVRGQAERLAAAGVTVLDVPVTGGVARARTGDLTLFAAGASGDLDAARPILERLGAVHHVGAEIGSGQSIKIVNQHLCSVHIVAAAEALALAGELGLDQKEVLPLLEQGSGRSWMLSNRGPRMLQCSNVEVTSTVGIFVKDSDLVACAAREAGLPTPLLDAARDRFRLAAEAGLTQRDDSRVVETYRCDD